MSFPRLHRRPLVTAAVSVLSALLPVAVVFALTISPIPPRTNPVSTTRVDVSWDTDLNTASDNLQYGRTFTRNWTAKNISTAAALNDVFARDSKNAYAVTSDGYVFKTTDGGSSWPTSNFITASYVLTSVAGSPTGNIYAGSNATTSEFYVIDSSTLNLVRTCTIGAATGSIRDLAFDGSRLWIVTTSTTIYKVDPATCGSTPYDSSATGLGARDPSATSYTSITLTDPNHVWATSNDVAIVWTANGGTSWTAANQGSVGDNCLVFPPSPTCIYFEDIKAANATTAFAASRNGGIFRFDGASWSKLPTPFTTITTSTRPDFTSIGLGDANHAIFLGSPTTSGRDYYAVMNDGRSVSGLVEFPIANTTGTLGVWFTNPNVGWVVGNAGRVSAYSVSYNINNALSASGTGTTGPHNAVVNGLQQSVNYHANAKSTTSPLTEAESGDFLFTSGGLSILAPGIDVTPTATDATLTWTTSPNADARAYAGTAVGWQTNTLGFDIQDVAVQGDQAFVVGTNPNEIHQNSSFDITQPWPLSYQNNGPLSFLLSVSMAGSKAWAAGREYALRYDGASWTTLAVPNVNYYSIFALDDQHVWMGGDSTLIRTTDGGTTWSSFDLSGETFRGVFAVDANLVLAVGDNSRVYRSTDGGLTWARIDASSTLGSVALSKITMLNAQEGWAVGNNATVARTLDGGFTWTKFCIENNVNQNIADVDAFSSTDVWIVGDNATAQRWTGSGCFAEQNPPGATSFLRSVEVDASGVWIGGLNGYIARRGLNPADPNFRSQAVAGFTGPHSITLSGLNPGTSYNYFVQSTDANSFTVVSALNTFQTLPVPTLELAPTSLSFTAPEGGADPPAQTFTVKDQFGGNIGAWTATKTSGGSWLTFAPANGAGSPMNVTVSPSISGLTAGVYTGTIEVSAPAALGSPKTLNVTLTITPPPKLSLDTTSVSFNAQVGDPLPAEKTVNVTNAGGGTLNFTMTKLGGAAWLDVSAANGVSPYPTPNQIRIRPNTTASAGTFTETIRVTGVSGSPVQNSPQDISVTYTVQGPDLRLTPGPNPSLTFNAVKNGPNPTEQTVTIENGGGGTLSWTATSAEPWLQFVPANDGNGPTTFRVRPQTGTLPAGTHNGSITINAGTALNSPQTISVLFTITEQLVVNPTSLSFSLPQGTNTDDKTFVVQSGDPAGWNAVDPVPVSGPDWISLTGITSGNAYPSPPVNVHVDTTGLAVGVYNESVTVNSPGATPPSTTVSVTLNVTPPPQLAVDPTTVNLTTTEGGPNPTGSFSISNVGVGTLNWSIAQPAQPWVKITDGLCGGPYGPLSGTAPATINVCTDVTGLTVAGSPYNSSVTVQAPGAVPPSQVVNIILTITPDTTPPAIDPTSIQIVPFSDCAGSNTGAEISWRTDEASDSEVWWGQQVDGTGVPLYEEGQIIVAPDPVDPTLHRVVLDATNLIVGGHLYYIKLRSTDLRGNQSPWVDHDPADPTRYLTFIAPAACDIDPPENFTVTFPPNPLSGTVNVDFSAEDASGINRFELQFVGFPPFAVIAPSPGACILVSPSRFQCTATLAWNTTSVADGSYQVIGTAYDAADNSTASTPASVDIENTPPRVTNVNANPVRQPTGLWNATITWDTDKASTSFVRYGLEDTDGTFSGYTDQKAGDDDATCNGRCMSHSVTLTNLLHARIYHYEVESCSPANPSLCGN